MMTTTPQQLGRTAEAHHHDDLDTFCLNCIKGDLFKPDARADLALLTCIHLRHLAEHRAAQIGSTWEDTWHDVLDPQALAVDLTSADTLRRALVRRAQLTVQDFLVFRKATATSHPSNAVIERLRQIEARTRVQLAELGIERRSTTFPQPRN